MTKKKYRMEMTRQENGHTQEEHKEMYTEIEHQYKNMKREV